MSIDLKVEGTARDGQRVRWLGDVDPLLARKWLVKTLLPETGTCLISGQWATHKTFVVLDLAAAVMAGEMFIKFPVKRRGGVLFFAAEGGSEVEVRMNGVLGKKYPDLVSAPFAWSESVPRLLDPNALRIITMTAREVAERMQAEFNLPLALIVFDTIVASAGYGKAGDDNDTALAQTLMSVLGNVSKETGALVIGVDHFGKVVETGTRGSSAKEGSADTVLALLGDKAASGAISNVRLAARKRRGGVSGEEFPFKTEIVDIGVDEDGEKVTTLVIDWSPKLGTEIRNHTGGQWTKSTQSLRRALMNVLADHGAEERPCPDGPIVRAVDLEILREEFYRSHIAGDNSDQTQAARQKAFRRAINAAQDNGLIGIRDVLGATRIWFARPEDNPSPNAWQKAGTRDPDECSASGQTGAFHGS